MTLHIRSDEGVYDFKNGMGSPFTAGFNYHKTFRTHELHAETDTDNHAVVSRARTVLELSYRAPEFAQPARITFDS